MIRFSKRLRIRARTVLLLCFVIPAGFAFKWYKGPQRWWFNDYGAAVMYEIFWCLAAFLFWPYRRHSLRIASFVLTATCILEFMQLWKPPFLQIIRATFFGASLIGTTFVWWDFPHYVLGCALGWLLMRLI
jgi:hypothetical protein